MYVSVSQSYNIRLRAKSPNAMISIFELIIGSYLNYKNKNKNKKKMEFDYYIDHKL